MIIFCILQGGLDNIESAKTYYSQALKLNPNNIRALYGLYLVILLVGKIEFVASFNLHIFNFSAVIIL